jgi:hypothetical protein
LLPVPSEVVTVAALAVDTATCALIALRFAPPRAAKLVEEQAGGVFDRTMKPKLVAMLAAERAAIVAELERVTREADAKIAAAQARLQEQHAAMVAEVEKRAREVEERAAQIGAEAVEQAKAQLAQQMASDAGRALAEKSVDAREAKEAQRVLNEGRLMAVLGPAKAAMLEQANGRWYGKLLSMAPPLFDEALKALAGGAGPAQQDGAGLVSYAQQGAKRGSAPGW